MHKLQTIIDAINSHSLLKFRYRGIDRLVEPHAVGISKKGKSALRCLQIHEAQIPDDHERDFFTVSYIDDLEVIDSCFSEERPGYSREDKDMIKIYAHLQSKRVDKYPGQ